MGGAGGIADHFTHRLAGMGLLGLSTVLVLPFRKR
jgi:hypothetical protein